MSARAYSLIPPALRHLLDQEGCLTAGCDPKAPGVVSVMVPSSQSMDVALKVLGTPTLHGTIIHVLDPRRARTGEAGPTPSPAGPFPAGVRSTALDALQPLQKLEHANALAAERAEREAAKRRGDR